MSDEPKKRARWWIGWVLVVVLIAVGIAAWGVGRTLSDRQRALVRTREINAQIRVLDKVENDPAVRKDPTKQREIHEEVERLVLERLELNRERQRLAGSPFARFLDLFRR
jgi:hypothetical protein